MIPTNTVTPDVGIDRRNKANRTTPTTPPETRPHVSIRTTGTQCSGVRHVTARVTKRSHPPRHHVNNQVTVPKISRGQLITMRPPGFFRSTNGFRSIMRRNNVNKTAVTPNNKISIRHFTPNRITLLTMLINKVSQVINMMNTQGPQGTRNYTTVCKINQLKERLIIKNVI